MPQDTHERVDGFNGVREFRGCDFEIGDVVWVVWIVANGADDLTGMCIAWPRPKVAVNQGRASLEEDRADAGKQIRGSVVIEDWDEQIALGASVV